VIIIPDQKPQLKIVRHDLGIDLEKAYIIPLSDLHIGADFDDAKFLGYREWILNTPLEWSGYPIRKGYKPASLGSPRIRLNGTRKDVHVSV
jgi:hypothetical protein